MPRITASRDRKTYEFLGRLQDLDAREIQTEVRKRLDDFASLSVPPQRGTPDPAPWQADKQEMVEHYRQSSYVAIGCVARKVAMQEPEVWVVTRNSEGIEERRLHDHVILDLFRHVNPIHTQFDLWFHTIAWMLATGDSYLWKVRNGLKVPSELWVMPSPWVRAVPSETEFISSYNVRAMFGAQEEDIDARDMIHIREPNLNWAGSGRFYGYSPMVAGAIGIDLEEQMLRRLFHRFKNYAEPGIILQAMSELENPTTEDLLDMQAWIHMQHSRAEHTGAPMMLPWGYQKAPDSGNKELDYITSLDKTLEMTLAIFGVPKAIPGLVKDSNRANMLAAMHSFCENNINPRLTHLGQHVTQGLAVEFDEKLVVRFPMCTVDDAEQMRKDFETASKTGATTPNEVRELLLSLPPFKHGGDFAYIPTSMQVADHGNEDPSSLFEDDELDAEQPTNPEIPQSTDEQDLETGDVEQADRLDEFTENGKTNGRRRRRAYKRIEIPETDDDVERAIDELIPGSGVPERGPFLSRSNGHTRF